MRVLFVSPAASLGGVERCLFDNVPAPKGSDAGIEVGLIALAVGPLIRMAEGLGAVTQVIEPPAELAESAESGSHCQESGALIALISAAARFLATEEATTFGLVATYARWKGHALFVEAVGIVRAARPNLPLRVHVVGGPIYKTHGSQVRASEMSEHAPPSKIDSCFGLVPFQDDMARAYRSVNVGAHASTKPEPFDRTTVKGKACERAVVLVRAGGAAELFQDGENVLEYELGNAAAPVKRVAATLDANMRGRLAFAVRDHAVREFGARGWGPSYCAFMTNDTGSVFRMNPMDVNRMAA